MSNKQLKLKIITPERLVLEEMVDQVSLPTTLGEITVLPDHIPLITGLSSGDIVALTGGEYIPIAVAGGFLEVEKDPPARAGENGITTVAVLADFAEHVSELSGEKIAEAKMKAEELKEKMKNKEDVDFEHFESELERSLTRVKIADKWRTKKYRR